MARRRNDDDEDEVMESATEDEGPIELESRYVARRPKVDDAEADESDDAQIIPDRVLRIPLAAPWSHLRIYGWFDYPKEIADRMTAVEGESNEEAAERVMGVLRDVIVQHDGWRDPRDRNVVLPQPNRRAFWEAIPNALATAIIRSYFSLVKRNPTPRGSRPKTKRR